MNKLDLISVTSENRDAFHTLMKMYAKELDEHQHRNTDPELLLRWTDRMIRKQFDTGHCLKLCCHGEELIGFLYGTIDKPGDKGYNRVGWGCIMEFTLFRSSAVRASDMICCYIWRITSVKTALHSCISPLTPSQASHFGKLWALQARVNSAPITGRRYTKRSSSSNKKREKHISSHVFSYAFIRSEAV